MDAAEEQRILEIVRAAAGDPALLALVPLDLTFANAPEAERARLREALIAAAVPHWFDGPLLAALLAISLDEAGDLMPKLRRLTNVETFPARGESACNVHEASRGALRRMLREDRPDRFRELSSLAMQAMAADTAVHARIERLYHHFAADSDAAASECEALDLEVTLLGREDSKQALAGTLKELLQAGWLTGKARTEAVLSVAERRNSRGETASLEPDAREVIRLAGKFSAETAAGRGHALLGDVLIAQGNIGGALNAYRNYFTISERLAAQDTGNAGWQRSLAVAYSKLGDVLRLQGKLVGALDASRVSLAISKRLASQDVGNAGWQSDLANAHAMAGTVMKEQGNLDEALDACRKNFEIRERLTAQDASNKSWQRNLAVALANLGDVLNARSNRTEALDAYQKSLTISERLAAQDTGNAGWQRSLAVAYSKFGDVLSAQGNRVGVLDFYRRHLAILERLTARDTSNAGWQRDLAVAHAMVGNILGAQGNLGGALDAYRKDLAIFELLTARDVGNAGWRRDLALAHKRLGQLFHRIHIRKKAKEHSKKAVNAMRQAVLMSPSNTWWREDLEQMELDLFILGD